MVETAHETGLWTLAEDIEGALKDEIEMRISEDMSDEDIQVVKLNAWVTFYNHTLQYHQVSWSHLPPCTGSLITLANNN